MPPPPEAQKPPNGVGEMLKQAVTAIAERSTRGPQQSSQSEKDRIQEEKRKAREKVEKLKHGIKSKTEASKTPELDEEALRQMLGKRETRGQSKWLVGDENEIPEDPVILHVVAEIASAPPELQNDPTWLLAKGAELRNSLRADMPGNVQQEARNILKRIYQKIADTQGVDMGNVQIRISKDPEVRKKVEFVEFAGSNLLPEAGQMPVGPTALSRDWLMIHNAPTTPPSDPRLVDAIDELRKVGKSPDWHEISKKWQNLATLRDQVAGTDQQWVDMLREHVYETFKKMNGDRLTLSPEEVDALTRGSDAARNRDRVFYERIQKVLMNPNEETHKQLNLYDQADLDTFMGVISKAEWINPRTGRLEKIGQQVVGHYQNLLDTILRLSDMEFWARHPAGDVENVAKAVNYFENKFAVEAIKDPLVEDMLQCMEQAIKFIRDSNDGYVPTELTRYDPGHQTTYVDDLAIKFFEQRLEASAIRDYVRNPETGVPQLDPATGETTFLRSDRPFHFSDIDEEEKKLRMLATLRMAKGVGIITNRVIELYAFTRTPGDEIRKGNYADQNFEQSIAVFSSKAYGGLTRWANPLSEWFRMYGFGDTLFVPFFNTLIGGPKGAEGKALGWTMDQVRQAMDIADTGDIDQLRTKFGDGIVRLMDMVQEMSFSGRFGPLSMWGMKDATQGWTALDYERLGGSMRLTLASSFTEGSVKDEFKQANSNKGWNNMQMEEEWLRAKLGLEGWGEDNPWKQKITSRERAYKTWIWTQFIMRNPQGAASHIWVDSVRGDNPDPNKNRRRERLRSKILHEIFTSNDLQQYGLTDLVVERDVASGHSVTGDKRRLMDRLAIVDADLMAVMRYAMNTGDRPRDIMASDFETCIKGDKILRVKDQDVVITESRRREQALDFWKKVQRELLGKAVGDTGQRWDVNRWRQELGAPVDWNVKSDEIMFTNGENTNEIFDRAQRENPNIRLTKKEVDKQILVHAGTEDVQWSYLDINALGDRHWGRRAGDFLTRAKTLQLMMKHFHLLTGKAKMEDLVKSIADIGRQEKDHDPKESAKFSSLWGIATHNIFRQRHLAGIPLIGRLLPSLGIPMSIAQERLGVHSAQYWSINNSVQFADMLGETRVIPDKRIVDGRDYGSYTMEEFRKNTGASRLLAALEMLAIGIIIAHLLAALDAGTKSVEDEKRS